MCKTKAGEANSESWRRLNIGHQFTQSLYNDVRSAMHGNGLRVRPSEAQVSLEDGRDAQSEMTDARVIEYLSNNRPLVSIESGCTSSGPRTKSVVRRSKHSNILSCVFSLSI